MHFNPHNVIAIITGAVSVNVITPLDAMFTQQAFAGLIIFCAKGVIGAGISVGINRVFDYFKNKKSN